MGIDLIYLKFKNVVSILVLYKIFQKKKFVRVEYISLFFPLFFFQFPPFFLLGRAPPSAVLALGCILAKMEAN